MIWLTQTNQSETLTPRPATGTRDVSRAVLRQTERTDHGVHSGPHLQHVPGLHELLREPGAIRLPQRELSQEFPATHRLPAEARYGRVPATPARDEIGERVSERGRRGQRGRRQRGRGFADRRRGAPAPSRRDARHHRHPAHGGLDRRYAREERRRHH